MLVNSFTNSRLLGILSKVLHGGASIQISTILSPAVIPEAPALLPAEESAALTLLPVPPPSQTYTHMLWMTTTPVHHGIFILNLTFFFFLGSCHVLHEILVPQLGFEPVLPAVEAWSLNSWTTREVP